MEDLERRIRKTGLTEKDFLHLVRLRTKPRLTIRAVKNTIDALKLLEHHVDNMPHKDKGND